MPAELQWKTDPELIELTNFLIERTKDSKSPLNITQLAEEFKEKSGSSQGIQCLVNSIYRFPPAGIHQLDSIDTVTKVRILFALSASVDKDFLKELQKEVDVEVDGNNRITKYKTKDYVSRIKFLEAIQSLVLNLDTPSLSPLKAKIDEKLRESPNEEITNDELILVIELLIAKIAKHSMLNLPENVESVRFSDFLCYLKSAILNSKFEGLDGLLDKIKEKIKEPASKDKNIPVEKVASALQHALDGISF